jgi:hypothetical protein
MVDWGYLTTSAVKYQRQFAGTKFYVYIINLLTAAIMIAAK